MFFAIETKKDLAIVSFRNFVNDYFESNESFVSPVKVNVKIIDNILFFKVDIMFPKVQYLTIPILFCLLYFNVSLWFYLGLLPFVLIGVLVNKYVIYLYFKALLKKKGYKYKSRIMKKKEMMDKLYEVV